MKISETGMVISGVIAVFIFLVNNVFFESQNTTLNVMVMVCAAFVPLFGVGLYFKNFSTAVFCRLLRELNVIIIFLYTMFNLIIEAFGPSTDDRFESAVFGLLYFAAINVFTFMDTLKLKSRTLVLIVGVFGVLALNIINIVVRIFTARHSKIVLLKYNILHREFYFYRRSIQRSIFIQILTFSANGIWTLMKDKETKYLMFGTGYVNRITGEPALSLPKENDAPEDNCGE